MTKIYICILFLCSVGLYAQNGGGGVVKLDALSTESSSLVEKSDWMRYDNGKYVGHVYREVRASIVLRGAAADGTRHFKGNFFVLEETLRDLRASARAVNDVVPVQFKMYKNGNIEIEDDRGFPSLRDFPVYKNTSVQAGDKWRAEGERAVDPLNNGATVRVPFLAEYEYKGIELYKDIPVYRINARYASRFAENRARPINFDSTPSGPAPFTALTGKHDVDILIRVSNGALLLSRDNLDETFSWPDGRTVRFRGFTLTFGQGLSPMNHEELVADIRPPAESGIQVAKVEEGVRLTISDLQFKPDSDELLDNEAYRLNLLADSLRKIPDRTFLVEGHTASIGSPEGEVELSVARAKRIVDELAGRGIEAGRFIYKGWGGARPAADNATDEGRKINRRVEITIIE